MGLGAINEPNLTANCALLFCGDGGAFPIATMGEPFFYHIIGNAEHENIKS